MGKPLFDPEDGGDTFLGNIGVLLPNYNIRSFNIFGNSCIFLVIVVSKT
jgi:hypothetical protein